MVLIQLKGETCELDNKNVHVAHKLKAGEHYEDVFKDLIVHPESPLQNGIQIYSITDIPLKDVTYSAEMETKAAEDLLSLCIAEMTKRIELISKANVTSEHFPTILLIIGDLGKICTNSMLSDIEKIYKLGRMVKVHMIYLYYDYLPNVMRA
jgi:hypothetical protein